MGLIAAGLIVSPPRELDKRDVWDLLNQPDKRGSYGIGSLLVERTLCLSIDFPHLFL